MDTSRDQQSGGNTPFPSPTRKRKSNEQCYSPPNENQRNEEADNSWLEVCKNIKRMDALYDATFYAWLKSEENVFVTSIYLHRIANQYPLPRIMNGLKWLISDWHLESIRVLVEKVTQDWHGSEGDISRGILLRHMTHNWAPQFTASLISHILTSPPYALRQSNNGMNIAGNERTPQSEKNFNNSKARFLKHLTSEYDYSKLSEFLMYLGPGNNSNNNIGPFDSTSEDGTPVLDHRIKITLLKDAARREKEREALRKSANYNGIINSSTDNSDEIVDKKRPRLSNEEDEIHAYVSTSSSSVSSPPTSLFPMSSTSMNHSNLRMQANSSHTHTRNSSMSSMTSSHTRNSSMSSVNTPSSSITSSTSISTQEGAVSIPSSQRPTHFMRSRRQGRRNSYSYNPMLILASAAVNEATTSTTSPSTSTSSNQNTSAANASSILRSAMTRDDTNGHKSSVSTAQESNNPSITSTHHIHAGISSVDDDSSIISGDLSSAAKRIISHDI